MKPGVGTFNTLMIRSTQSCDDLTGGALAGTHGTFHIVHPDSRRLRAGPMHATERFTQHPAITRPAPGREISAIATARPFFFRPAGLDIFKRLGGVGTEE